MFCRNCGKKISDDTTSFCPDCGMSLKKSKTSFTMWEKLFIGFIFLSILLFIYYSLTSGTPENSPVNIPEPEKTVKSVTEPVPELITDDGHSPKKPGTLTSKSIQTKDSPNSKLYSEIGAVLQGLVNNIEIKQSTSEKGVIVKANIISDVLSSSDAMDYFSSFFSVCYSDSSANVEFASIILVNSQRKEICETGIGVNKSSELSSGTWQGMKHMGSFLKRWVLERTNPSPATHADACYHREYQKN